MSRRREGKITVSDACIGIWEEAVCEEEFKAEVLLRLARYLKSQGWKFHVPYADYAWLEKDRKRTKNRPHFAESKRRGIKDGLEVELSITGRHLEINFWEDVTDHSDDNSSGGRYVFDKEKKMPYRQLCRYRATKVKILKFLTTWHNYTISEEATPIFPRKLTAIQFVEKDYCGSWHKEVTDIFDPAQQDIDMYNAKSADGSTVEHGSTVWATDYRGNWIQGVALHNLNNMWWVLAGKYTTYNIASFNIYVNKPDDLKNRMPTDSRIRKLKQHIEKAVNDKKFLKAHAMQTQLEALSIVLQEAA